MGLFGKKKKIAPVVGLYGKHPSADDFLRLNAGGAEVRALDEWLSAALPACERLVPRFEETYLEQAAVSFLFGDARSETMLIGALAPSRDRIGRRYPLILFAAVAAVDVQPGCLPALPFLRSVGALLARRDRLTRETLLDGAATLAAPDEGAWRTASADHERYLDETTARDALQALFAGAPGQEERALGILADVCRSVTPDRPPGYGMRLPLGDDGRRGAPADSLRRGGAAMQAAPNPTAPADSLRRGGAAMQAAASDGSHAALWLELLQRLLPARVLPNVLWGGGAMLTYFVRLPSKALAALWHTAWQDDTLYDLAREPSDALRLPNLPLDLPLRALVRALP